MANGDTATTGGSNGISINDLSSLLPAEPQPQPQAQAQPSTAIDQPTADQQPAQTSLVQTQTKQEPAFFGMRVATPQGVQDFENYTANGGDINQIPVYDRLAVALAKDPLFLTKPENFESYYSLVYKPLQQQAGPEKFAQAIRNIGPSLVSTLQNVGQGLANGVELDKDEAEVAFRKATGLVHDPGYESATSRLANELATQAQGMGGAFSQAWNFVTGIYNGLIQTTRPLAERFTQDPQSKDQLDRMYAKQMQTTVASQQALAHLGNQVQDFAANAYKTIGAFGADVGQKMQNATPNEAAAEGLATLYNPLNYVPELASGLKVVGAFKPVLLDRTLQSMEDVAGATARKSALDVTQMLPENPEINAATPGYVEGRNLQSQFAGAARTATQDLADKSATLNQVLTDSAKIGGDPGTATWLMGHILQGGGAAVEQAGNIAEKVTQFPDNFGNWVGGGNPWVKDMVSDGIKKGVFGTALELMGPVGGVAESALEHLPDIADSVSGLAKTAGKELLYGETTLPFGQRVAQGTKLMPKFMAQAIDSPLVVTATNLAKGFAAGATTGAVLSGLQEAGSVPGGGIGGAVSGFAQGGILGMAGAGFGQWQRFQDPNQYLLQARGDWKRYSDSLSPTEKQNFSQLSPTNQLMLAQNAQHFPGLKVNYVNNPTAPSFHYFDEGGRSNIQINIANPSSVIQTTLGHELIHGATKSGMLPDIYDSLFGNPQIGKIGQFTALDGQGNPIGLNPETGRYIANQDFDNLGNQYKNKMAQNGLPTAHLNDFAIAKEIYAENGTDYLLSGAPILDSNSAYRPILTSKPALKTALAKMGYTFDDNGRMIGAPGGPGGQVAGTGLFTDLQRNPALQNLAQSFYTQTWRDGKINNEEEVTHRFTQRDMQNPNVAETWLNNAPEIMRNQDGTAQRDPNTGLPIYRTPGQVREYNANFTKAIRSGLEALPEDQRADLGLRTTVDEKGRSNTFMRYLPDNVIDSLAGTNQYNPHQIASLRLLSRVLADQGNPGMEMRFFYNTALSAGKKYAAFEGREKIAVPYGIELTHDNQVNVKSVDFEQLDQNFQRVANREPFKTLWDTPVAFANDAHTYFTNHKEGRPGADAIGTQKRDAINALAGFGTQIHSESNPLVQSIPQSVRPIIKSYRIDRMNQASATGFVRPFVSEAQYYAANRNYLPRVNFTPSD